MNVSNALFRAAIFTAKDCMDHYFSHFLGHWNYCYNNYIELMEERKYAYCSYHPNYFINCGRFNTAFTPTIKLHCCYLSDYCWCFRLRIFALVL